MGRGAWETLRRVSGGGVQVFKSEGGTCWNQGRDVHVLRSGLGRTGTSIQAAWVKSRPGYTISGAQWAPLLKTH